MLQQLLFILFLINPLSAEPAQSQTRVYSRADFINVEGANLDEKIERAAQQFKASRQGDSCWLAYHFTVRENTAYGPFGSWNYRDDDGIRLERREDPAGAAIFLLTETGGAKPVFTRVKVLNINEPYTFENRPVYWLGNIDAAQSVAQLETILRASFAQPKEQSLARSALRVIGYHNSPRVVTLLEEFARQEQQAELQRAAIAGLGQYGTKEGLDALDKLFNATGSAAVKREIVRAYGYAGERAEERRVLERLTNIAKANETAEVRVEAVRRLAGLRSAEAAERLFQLYDELNDQRLRRELIQHVYLSAESRDSRTERVARRLLAIAKSGNDAELQCAAVRRLGGVRGDDHLDVLLELYDSATVDGVKEEVIYRLARSENRKAADKLMKIARDDPNPKLRQAAIRRLSK